MLGTQIRTFNKPASVQPSSLKEFMQKLDDIKNGKYEETTKEDDRPIHRLVQIPSTKKKWPQKPCVYCRKNKVRRDTRYMCPPCDAALCKDCFSKYHANIRKYIRICNTVCINITNNF